MKNMKVSYKLIVSFMIITLLAIAIGVIGLVGMYSINAADDELYNKNVVALSSIGNIREVLQDQRVQLRNYALYAGDSAKVQEINNTVTALDREIQANFLTYQDTIVDESAETSYYYAKRLYDNDFKFFKENIRVASLISSEAAMAEIFNPAAAAVIDGMFSGFDDAMVANDLMAKQQVDRNTNLFQSMLIIEVIVLVLTLVVAIFFALYISGLISKPLSVISAFMNRAGQTGDIVLTPDEKVLIGKYAQVKDEIGQTIAGSASFIEHVATIGANLEQIANNDLSFDINVLSDKDSMGISLKNMLGHLNLMFSEIQSSTNQVSSGSKQIADGAQALAQGSTEQAASIEELSSSISEISESTKENAITAGKTAKLSTTIKDNAEKGSRQMDEMITAVKDINDASQSISKIIKTIDDIAFQTNILALNAAVEAARAGQHGKGFAVVAEEVRNLASKSADAAKDTGDMIQNSMEKAELGSRIAGETAVSLKEIVTGINESSQMITEIAQKSESQSMGIEQINVAVDQVAQVVQQNSATAQESAASSEEMSGQSEVLQNLITQFKLKGATGYKGLPTTERKVQAERPPARKRIVMPKDEVTGYPVENVSGDDFGKY